MTYLKHCLFVATALAFFQVNAQPRRFAVQQTRNDSRISEPQRFKAPIKEVAPTFHSHTTDSPQTLKPGQFAYLSNSGVDPTEENRFGESAEAKGISFLFNNSLHVGTFSWLTIGTNPLFWALIPGSLNGSLKLRIFQTKALTFSFGYSHLSMTKLFSARQDGFSLNVIWRINPYFSLAHSTVTKYLENSMFGQQNLWQDPSHFFDLEYRLNSSFSVTPSVSWSKGKLNPEIPQTKVDPRTYGVGSSVTWMTPKGWFADPAVGAHIFPENSTYQAMFSIYFH